jgi:hypothetical protein
MNFKFSQSELDLISCFGDKADSVKQILTKGFQDGSLDILLQTGNISLYNFISLLYNLSLPLITKEMSAKCIKVLQNVKKS